MISRSLPHGSVCRIEHRSLLEIAQRAPRRSGEALGPEYPDVASSLGNLDGLADGNSEADEGKEKELAEAEAFVAKHEGGRSLEGRWWSVHARRHPSVFNFDEGGRFPAEKAT